MRPGFNGTGADSNSTISTASVMFIHHLDLRFRVAALVSCGLPLAEFGAAACSVTRTAAKAAVIRVNVRSNATRELPRDAGHR